MNHPRLSTKGIETLTDEPTKFWGNKAKTFVLRQGVTFLEDNSETPHVSLLVFGENYCSVVNTYVGKTMLEVCANKSPEDIVRDYLDLILCSYVSEFISEPTPRQTPDGVVIGKGKIYYKK